MPIPAIMAMAIAQGMMGAGQKIGAANKRSRAERNFDEFEVPQGVMSMLDVAHGMSSQRELPGSGMFRERAMGGLSSGVEEVTRSSESGADVLGSLQDMFGSYMGFEKDLLVKGLEQQREAKINEMGVLGKIGEYQSEQWKYNELYPYMQRMTAAGEQDLAGNQSFQSALSTGINAYQTEWSMGEMDRMLEEYGKNKSGG